MAYEKKYNLGWLAAIANDYADLAMEYKDPEVDGIVEKLGTQLQEAIEKLKNLKGDPTLAAAEPSDLEGIRALRPDGVRRISKTLSADFKSRLTGALVGRIAGCILGAIVEAYSVEDMAAWAKYHGDNFPPTDYWTEAPGIPGTLRYTKSPNEAYIKRNLCCAPVDDDICYTLLGLVILEEYGPDFTVADVGKAWAQYLPMAYTAEEIALNHVKEGMDAMEAGGKDNAYVQLLGADIRSDPWGYVTPGWPEKAASLAWRDGYLSHRRNGLFAEMYFSAVISAAFVCKDVWEALEIGLQEIPKDCWFAKEVRWALDYRHNIHDYKEARKAVDDRFPGMPIAHTVNNACLTIFGLHIGGTDFSKVISETVAMGMDNDCTTATAGSILGAVIGIENIDEKWYKPFNNIIDSYLKGIDNFAIDDTVERFIKQAEKIINL